VAVQVRRAFENANKDAEIWLRAIMAPMETQVREHQIQLKRRLESIKRIHQATDTLEDRIAELESVEKKLVDSRLWRSKKSPAASGKCSCRLMLRRSKRWSWLPRKWLCALCLSQRRCFVGVFLPWQNIGLSESRFGVLRYLYWRFKLTI
jgi:hypothetical protein